MSEKLRACLNKCQLEQVGFLPGWTYIIKEYAVLKLNDPRDKICWLLADTCFDIVPGRNRITEAKPEELRSVPIWCSVKRHLKPRVAKTSCLSRGSIIPSSTSFAAPSDSQELNSPNIQMSHTTTVFGSVLDGFSHEFLMIFLYLC